MSKEQHLFAERVRELLNYDPKTGVITWRVSRRGTAKAGRVAGTITPSGYRSIFIGKYNYRAHRLAWLYVHGVWPDEDIDHINGNKADNRISNLRAATHGQNMQNRPRQRNNTSGFKGVTCRKGRWLARMTVNGEKRLYLGSFDTPEQAYAAYCEAAARLHTHNPAAIDSHPSAA